LKNATKKISGTRQNAERFMLSTQCLKKNLQPWSIRDCNPRFAVISGTLGNVLTLGGNFEPPTRSAFFWTNCTLPYFQT